MKADNKPKRPDFSIDMLHRMDMEPCFLPSTWYFDEFAFHRTGSQETQHKLIILGMSSNPQRGVQRSPNMKVCCDLMKERIFGPSFIMETIVTGVVFMMMLEQIV
jgi:hypothetical protein